MKTIRLALLALLLAPVLSYADTLYDYGGDSVQTWKVQAIYKEKYIEDKWYFSGYHVFNKYYDGGLSTTTTAMEQNIMLRMGLPDHYTLDMGFLYIYQRDGALNYNNMQAASVFVEKYNKWWGLIAGLKIPFRYGMTADPHIIDMSDEFNTIFGLFLKVNPGSFRYSLAMYDEENILGNSDYEGDMAFTGSAGVNFYSSDDQKIDFVVETAYKVKKYGSLSQYAFYVTPEFKVDFYNDFYFIIGAEFYIYAQNMYMPDMAIPLYMAKINYVLNSDKREEKPKPEEKKPSSGPKQWWSIDGVDDEMIPESWKDEAYERSIGKYPK